MTTETKQSTITMPVFEKKSFWVMLIFSISCLLYANTLNHQYAYDDMPFIVNNEFVQDGISGIPKILTSSYWDGNTKLHHVTFFSYRPVPAITFAIETELFKGNPFPRHLIQILLYALMCCLLFLFLQLLFPKIPIYIIGGICLLFVAHPLHTEIVANLKNRDELLGFLFATLGLWLLIEERLHKGIRYGIATLCFVLALLSKETAAILMGSLLLFTFFKNKGNLKSVLRLAIPTFISVGIYGVLRFILSSGQDYQGSISNYDNPILFANSLSETIATKICVLGKMQQLLWLPYSLQYEYGFAEIVPTSFANPMVWFSIVVHLLLFFVLYRFRQNNLVVWGIIVYFVSIGLIGNVFFSFPVALAERFLLIPSLYVCVLLVALMRPLLSNNKFIPLGLGGLVFILFSMQTVNRNPAWANNKVLFKTDLPKTAESVRANIHYGRLLLEEAQTTKDKNKVNKAIQHLEKAHRLKPDRIILENYLALFSAYKIIGNIPKAKEYLDACIQKDPNNIETRLYQSELYIELGKYDAAIKNLSVILQKSPNSYQALWYMGFIYGTQGNLPKAIEWLEKAYTVNPNSKDVCRYLSKAYGESGNAVEAQKYAQRLKKLTK